MAKNIIIQNNGVAVTYTGIKKIKTRKATGGTLYWLPEDEVQRGTINITANGTYKASTAGVYAFSQANVNVPGKPTHVSGKGQDGNMYDVTVDPDTEEITRTEIPAGISITTPPPKVSYVDGEIIDYTGMVVKWVDGNGEPFDCPGYPGGVIPSNELILTEHTAHSDGQGEQRASSEFYDDIIISDSVTFKTNDEKDIVYTADAGVLLTGWFESPNVCSYVAASKESGKTVYKNGQAFATTRGRYKYDDKTVYFHSITQSSFNQIGCEPDSSQDATFTPSKVAWTMIYGDVSGGTQTIPVSVLSPFDAKQYTDTFDIIVHENAESGTAH